MTPKTKKIIIISLIVILSVTAIFLFTKLFKKQPQTNTEKVKQTFQQTSSQTQKNQEKFQETSFKDQSDQSIPLKDFNQTYNLEIQPQIYDNLDQLRYSTFFCYDSPQKNAIGLKLHLNLGETTDTKEARRVFDIIQTAFQAWDQSVSKELKGVLFPDQSIDQTTPPASGKTTFTASNGFNVIDVYYVNLKSQTGQDLSIDYALLSEEIFISNDPDCLRNALNYYQDEPGL